MQHPPGASARTPSPQQIEAQNRKQAHAASGSKVKVLANIGIIVTGTALTHILGDDDCEHALLTVARCCKAVVACRVSPQQKANIVKMVRECSRISQSLFRSACILRCFFSTLLPGAHGSEPAPDDSRDRRRCQ